MNCVNIRMHGATIKIPHTDFSLYSTVECLNSNIFPWFCVTHCSCVLPYPESPEVSPQSHFIARLSLHFCHHPSIYTLVSVVVLSFGFLDRNRCAIKLFTTS